MSTLINGTIKNYAKRRGVDIEIVPGAAIDSELDQVWFYDAEDDCEPVLMYNYSTEILTYKGSLMRSLTDLPGTISTSAKLKELINYISTELK